MHPIIAFQNLQKRRVLIHSFSLGSGDLVLDVGSGQNPNPRANVLCDRFPFDTTERNDQPLTIDRPLVIGDARRLPFKNKVFDFVICSHLLEHVENPQAVMGELQRVGKRGYIETPSAIWEKLRSYPFHRWYVRLENGGLHFTPKRVPFHDPELLRWLSDNRKVGGFFESSYAEAGLLVQYWWQERIVAHVESNGNVDPSSFEKSGNNATEKRGLVRPPATLGEKCISLWGRSLRWRSDGRIREWEKLVELFACPKCSGSLRQESRQALICRECGFSYPVEELLGLRLPHLVT